MQHSIAPNKHESPALRLRKTLESGRGLTVCPRVYDGLSARIALDVGFDALYMTGGGTTASRLGQPDLGLAQLADMRANAERIANLNVTTPLIADMDNGFGGPMMIERAVTEYTRAGVAAFHIEDQVFQKRCGHLNGKEVVDLEEYITRVRATKLTKEKIGSDIVIIGRTDALQKHGYDEAIRRLRAAHEAGTDVGQLEGVTSKEMARQAVQDLAPLPLLLNMVEHGATPGDRRREARARLRGTLMLRMRSSSPPKRRSLRATACPTRRLTRSGSPGLEDIFSSLLVVY